MVRINAAMRATTRNLSRTSDGPSPSRLPSFFTAISRKRIRVVGITVKILPAELSNNEPEDIVQKSATTIHDLPPSKPTNEFEIPQDAEIQESADIEEPNVPSTEDVELTELVNAEVEFILERSTTESRDVPTVAASPIDHALFTTNKSTPLSSTMPPPPP
ncbi:hypothetical protein K3495_g7258 [Podosphaera aphanis]|nr:hypothetical protein K3495_g7258 [Podosphaera aphanis]